MDVNPSRFESSQHLIILGDDFAQSFKTKSFRCSFCKRGFSNAQALGGHMNIHRKDRAKLHEFSDENLLSLDISGGTDSNDNNLPPNSFFGEKLSFENNESHDQVENLNDYSKGIPLFAEAPAPANNVVKGTKVELKYDGLDLELRLGPEPHHHAKSKP